MSSTTANEFDDEDLPSTVLGDSMKEDLFEMEEEIKSKKAKGKGSIILSSSFNSRMVRKAASIAAAVDYTDYLDDLKKYNTKVENWLEEFDHHKNEFNQNTREFLQKTLLRPNFSLKNQLLLSFGIVSAASLCAVMAIAIIGAASAGDRIKVRSRMELTRSTESDLAINTRYICESLSSILVNGCSSNLLHEFTTDRFVGYPHHKGYADDSLVPFFDTISGRNVYPLNASSPLPLDWEFEPNVNAQNHREHVRKRWSWYGKNPKISTATASYYMQGACDPSVIKGGSYPNCTQANNNLTTGGVVQPTPTNELIAKKAADLNFMLKPLYEFHGGLKRIGIHFANSGAGSGIWFPARRLDNSKTYISLGCDWMSTPNPRDPSRPIAPQEEIDRCHPKGTVVPGREYNPLEREWCQKQALDPEKAKFVGPYRDIFDDSWIISVGRAVYDRVTNEFIACTVSEIKVETIKGLIKRVKMGNVTSETAMVRWNKEGTIIAATKGWDPYSANETTTITSEDFGMGVDQSTFEEMKSIVDFSKPWEPEEVRHSFKAIFSRNGKIISCSPIPAIPDEYDENYRPGFIVVMSSDQKRALEVVDRTDQNIDEKVTGLIQFTLGVGFVGLCVIMLVVFTVSYQLTKPLQWMNRIGNQIVDNFGQELEKDVDITKAPDFRWIPRTEITALVQEFQKMVSNFSGKGIAKVAKKELIETKNPFFLLAEFQSLYQKRQRSGYQYLYGDSALGGHGAGANVVVIEPKEVQRASINDGIIIQALNQQHCHFGRNLRDNDDSTIKSYISDGTTEGKGTNIFRSPLFWWINGSIMNPLLVTIVAISVVVTWRVSTELPALVKDVEDTYMEMKADALELVTNLRAQNAGQVMFPALRDLHVTSRVASWLLMGGIEQSTSVTELVSGTEECKNLSSFGADCPFFQDPNIVPCECGWSNPFEEKCYDYEGINTRYLQKQYFSLQAQDYWPNGDRNSSSYPNTSYSSATTSWWTNISDVPGSNKGESPSGQKTSYDRMRAAAAASVVQIPIFNYQKNFKNSIFFSSDLAFDADGLVAGYSGCNCMTPHFSYWETGESAQEQIRPDICPPGKFGYDIRCNDWYANGMRATENNEAPLHVSAPFHLKLPLGGYVPKQRATLPLIDNSSKNKNTTIGMAIFGFNPSEIAKILQEMTPLSAGGFPILITSKPDANGADTVVGPGDAKMRMNLSPIADLVLPHDCKKSNSTESSCNTKNHDNFDNILEKMRKGESGSTSFTRRDENGNEETANIAFAPVCGLSFRPFNSSDFSRGAESYMSNIFSLALVETHPSLLRAFVEIKDSLQSPVNVSLLVLTIVVVVAGVLVILISNRVTVATIEPVRKLLTMVKHVNRSEIKEDMPLIHGGSREVSCVYSTFEKLYTVVRFSSCVFFSGDLDKAHEVLVDALVLFQKMKNEKAIGVANNNLGNTMLTMYRTMQTMGLDNICGMSQKELIHKGIAYFDNAVNSGEDAIEGINKETGFSLEYLVFMQQLSNRYFNRAMFLLTIRNHHESPDEAEQMGLSDLIIARDMDVEFIDQSNQEGFAFDEEVRFNLVLGRIRGLLLLRGMSYKFDWDIEELFDDAFRALRAAMKNPRHNLFRELSPVGHMQQLDAALIEYFMSEKNDVASAATVGIRMFVEDEYVFVESALVAIKSLIHYLDEESSEIADSDVVMKKLSDYKSTLDNVEISRCRDCPRNSILESRRGDVTMETF